MPKAFPVLPDPFDTSTHFDLASLSTLDLSEQAGLGRTGGLLDYRPYAVGALAAFILMASLGLVTGSPVRWWFLASGSMLAIHAVAEISLALQMFRLTGRRPNPPAPVQLGTFAFVASAAVGVGTWMIDDLVLLLHLLGGDPVMM